MIETAGHIALIVPYFAKQNASSLKGVGIYEYIGEHEWETWSVQSEKVVLTDL
jgi:hypothetical protein